MKTVLQKYFFISAATFTESELLRQTQVGTENRSSPKISSERNLSTYLEQLSTSLNLLISHRTKGQRITFFRFLRTWERFRSWSWLRAQSQQACCRGNGQGSPWAWNLASAGVFRIRPPRICLLLSQFCRQLCSSQPGSPGSLPDCWTSSAPLEERDLEVCRACLEGEKDKVRFRYWEKGNERKMRSVWLALKYLF